MRDNSVFQKMSVISNKKFSFCVCKQDLLLPSLNVIIRIELKAHNYIYRLRANY